MIRIFEKESFHIVSFDLSIFFGLQFCFLSRFFDDKRFYYEMFDFQYLLKYDKKFDLILCVGVLYHHSDPLGMLRSLQAATKSNREFILDTYYIKGKAKMASLSGKMLC